MTGLSRCEQYDSREEEEEEEEKEKDVEVTEDVVFSVVLPNGSDGGDRRGLRVLSPNVLGVMRAWEAHISSPRSAESSDESATSSQDWLCDI